MIKSYRVDNSIYDINGNLIRELVKISSIIYVEEGYFIPQSGYRFSKLKDQACILRVATYILDKLSEKLGRERICDFKFNEDCSLSYDKETKNVILAQEELSYSTEITEFKVNSSDYDIISDIDDYLYSIRNNAKLIAKHSEHHSTIINSYLGVGIFDKFNILNYLPSVKSAIDKEIRIKLH